MNYSLNEAEAMAKRAVRGAGYDWGVAEDVSKAVRWLLAQGLDGVGVLASILSDETRRGLAPCMAVVDTGQAEGTANPAMALACAALYARKTGATLTLGWDTAKAVTDGAQLQLDGDIFAATGPMSLTNGGEISSPCARETRAEPREQDWTVLAALADKTYAPATEESRLKGAGAGTNDND